MKGAGYPRFPMRRYVITAAAALAAAGLTVGLTLATRTTPPKPHTQAGRPPLVLDFGVRTDPEAVALRRAANLYDGGKAEQAAPVFRRYGSLEAEIGSALTDWPGGFGDLAALARAHPRSSLVQLAYGLALYWRGDQPGAEEAWRTARTAQPDTPYALRAEDLLHPNFPRGLPNFVPSFLPPPALARLSPPKQLDYLRAHATDVRGKLLYGVALQRLGQQLSALKEFEAAAALAPEDAEPKVAVAVGRFDKADPSRTFSRLGPLAKQYPRSQSVRFHLGLSLLWLGSVKKAKEELRLARKAGPRTPLGTEARRFLERLP
jgi:tetratricopeptide (TPR) repeat protein